MAAAIRKKTKPVSSSHANSTGVVKVHESVIASIVRKAALDVEGVLRLGTSSLMDNLAEIVGSKKIQDRSITVEMNESSVSVELRVILQYGVEIPQVANELKETVAAEITKLSGMRVDHVNIVVMDLEDVPQDGEDDLEE
ncbi:MAG: Asp23/Gls24 family envelope stress response protein [Victivallales bacterium]|jgi:hypothetical protein